MVTKVLFIGYCLVVALALAAVTTAQQPAPDSVQISLNTCYNAILDAYKSGADTNPQIEQLNQALNLTSQAQQVANSDPQLSQDLDAQTQAITENVTYQAIAAKEAASADLPITSVASISAVIIIGVSVYVFGPRLLWQTWFRLRRNYRVKIQTSKANDKAIVITAQQLCAVFLGITIILASVVVYQDFIPKNPGEQFSELGILGPNMKLGDYPSEVVSSEAVHLYAYVGNQMGQPMFYTVQVKLGDNNTAINPANLTSIRQYQQVLPSNGTWTFPIDVTMNKVGDNQRLIFELWVYNATTNLNQYHERWGQIWVNVTAPAS
jgi:uncharacterized membrane protein